MNDQCWLDSDVRQCCCVCRWHLVDYEHCTTNRELRDKLNTCICNIPKGYICVNPEIYEGKGGSSGWEKHSIGCECFEDSRKTIATIDFPQELS